LTIDKRTAIRYTNLITNKEGEMITREEKARVKELFEEVAEMMDEIVDIIKRDPYLGATVPGNLWAGRYGFLGEGPMDILAKWLDEDEDDDE